MATASSAARTEVLMFRKLIFVLCAVAFTLASCGRQVTPDRTGTNAQGLSAGFMEVKFNTYQPLDFVNVWYVIALNTDGTGQQPYPINGNQQRNWLGYSFELIVYQLPGQTGPQASLWEFTQQNVSGVTVKVPAPIIAYAPQQIQLTPNCDNSQTAFCVIIDRHLFSGLSGATPTPSPTSSASSSPTPSPTPSTSPTATPAPPAVAGIWNVNWFTVTPTSAGPQAGGAVIDAPGPLGVNDQTWLPPSGTYDTTTQLDEIWTGVPPPGWPQVTPPAAQIAGGEVINVP
jgi:hypothetical protein